MRSGRDFKVGAKVLVANTTDFFQFPAGLIYFELNARGGTAFRFSFNETEMNAGTYRTIRTDMDWYTQPGMILPDNQKIYLFCTANETIEIIYLIG